MVVRTASGRSRLAWVTTVPIAAVAGALVPVSLPAAIAAAAFAASFLLLAVGRGATRLFMTALVALLVGYMFMGRGFAYLGAPPMYIGEAVLILGGFALLTALPTRGLRLTHWLLIVFMAWGALRTLPNLGTYGTEALRDGVVWGYASFAIVVSLLVQPMHIRRFVELYGRLVLIFVAWVPILALIWFAYPSLLLSVPGSGIAIPYLKPGDMAVHLTGAAAFVLAGLYATDSWRRVAEPFLWVAWLAGAAFVASLNRGGMLALSTLWILILFTRPLSRWAIAGLVTLLLLSVAVVTDAELDTGGARAISAGQLVENIQSVFTRIDDPALSGSREWREGWWETIVGYTFEGQYFWDGKGYGINLADDDGFQVGDGSLRAPHNAHLNILARGGVPGLALWIAIQAALLFALLRGARAAARSGRRLWVALFGWISVYWLAALVNMTFDVYLEGPQGGIVFWSIVGLGLAAAACVEETREDLSPPGVDEEERRPRAAATT